MPKPQAKKTKIGRNDPCWCGSGRKYKDCHAPVDQAQRAELLRLRQAQDTLIPKIIEAAESVPERFPAAFAQFWNEEYGPEQMSELDDLEERGAERFLTWFAFDFAPEGEPTLITQLIQAAAADGFEIDEFEQRLLPTWAPVRLRPYLVLEVRKGSGLLVRDLLDERSYEVSDTAAAKRMEQGEIMVGHLVPVGGKAMLTPAEELDPPYGQEISDSPTYYLAGAAAQITGDTTEKLLEFVGLHLEDLRRSQPEATWDDLIEQRSYMLNHFVMALPQEYDPTIVDRMVMQTRITLQATGASLAGLVGRGNAPEADEPDTAVSARDESEK
jgi:hypothetical protein